MKYEIVYDTPGDKYNTRRWVVKVKAENLANRIQYLQNKDNIIYAVRQSN